MAFNQEVAVSPSNRGSLLNFAAIVNSLTAVAVAPYVLYCCCQYDVK